MISCHMSVKFACDELVPQTTPGQAGPRLAPSLSHFADASHTFACQITQWNKNTPKFLQKLDHSHNLLHLEVTVAQIGTGQDEAPAKMTAPMKIPASIPHKRHKVQDRNIICHHCYRFEVYKVTSQAQSFLLGLLRTFNDIGPGKKSMQLQLTPERNHSVNKPHDKPPVKHIWQMTECWLGEESCGDNNKLRSLAMKNSRSNGNLWQSSDRFTHQPLPPPFPLPALVFLETSLAILSASSHGTPRAQAFAAMENMTLCSALCR